MFFVTSYDRNIMELINIDTIRILRQNDEDFGSIFNELKRKVFENTQINDKNHKFKYLSKKYNVHRPFMFHHIDCNEFNNDTTNLIITTDRINKRLHSKKYMWWDTQQKEYILKCPSCGINKLRTEFKLMNKKNGGTPSQYCKICSLIIYKKQYEEKKKITQTLPTK